MPRKTSSSPLAARLAELNITAEEAATLARLPLADVEAMIDGSATAPDVQFRWLADDTDALRRVGQLRRTHTRNLEGEGVRYAGVAGLPDGTSDIEKVTG
jgi:hypothetical protein